MKKNYSVIIPTDIYPKPSQKELSAAYILANHFKTTIKFVPRSNKKTPDFLIKDSYWELKSPTGSGKHNIQHNIQDAASQSNNIIIDSRQSKMHPKKFKNEVQHQFNIIKKAKKLILIDKSNKCIEIFKTKC